MTNDSDVVNVQDAICSAKPLLLSSSPVFSDLCQEGEPLLPAGEVRREKSCREMVKDFCFESMCFRFKSSFFFF